MDLRDDRYSRIFRCFSLLVGQWPNDDSKVKQLKRFIILIVYISYGTVQIAKVVVEDYDLNVLLEILPSLMDALIATEKYFTCWANTNAIKHMLRVVNYNWKTLKSSSEREIMQKYTDEGWMYAKWYTWFVIAISFSFGSSIMIPGILDIVAPLNESQRRPLDFEFEYFVDLDTYYYLIILHVEIVIIIQMCVLVCADVTYIFLTFHACGMFGVVGDRFEHIFDDIQKISTANREAVFHSRIVDAIEYHLRTTEYIDVLVSRYGFSYVLQLFTIVLSITGVLFAVHKSIVLDKDVKTAIVFVLDLIGHYAALFFNIISSEKLADSSQRLFYTVYTGCWYRAPVNIQKLISFIIHKLSESRVLKFSVFYFSIETFANVIHLSFSYFTMICAIRE